MTAPAKESTAVATRDKNQREQLRTSLEKFQGSFAKVLPKHLTPDRMVTLALVAATKTPALLNCTPESIALAVMQVSQWGLDIGRTAHLVPFGNTCTAIADWKGLVQLLKNSGHVKDVKANAVYANERFIVSEGTNETLEHVRIYSESERGELIATYAVAWLKSGRPTWEVLGIDEIERIRKGARSGNSDAWKKHYDEMAKKTAIRRLAKRLPQTAELSSVLAVEEDDDPTAALARFAASVGIESPRTSQRATAKVIDSEPHGTPGGAQQAFDGYPGMDGNETEQRSVSEAEEGTTHPVDVETLSEAGRWEMPIGPDKGKPIGLISTEDLTLAIRTAEKQGKHAGFVVAARALLEERELAAD